MSNIIGWIVLIIIIILAVFGAFILFSIIAISIRDAIKKSKYIKNHRYEWAKKLVDKVYDKIGKKYIHTDLLVLKKGYGIIVYREEGNPVLYSTDYLGKINKYDLDKLNNLQDAEIFIYGIGNVRVWVDKKEVDGK